MATRKRRSGLIFFLLAFLLIIILVVIAYFMRDQLIALVIPPQEEVAEVPVVPTPVMYDIVVVIQPVKRGSELTEAMLGTVSYPQEDMVEGLFYTDLMEVVGKRAKYDLDPGTPLTPSLLSEGESGSFISFEIPSGMVAITIPIPSERYAVSYALKAGDHVNILAGMKILDLDQEFQTQLPNSIATIFKNEVIYGEDGPSTQPIDLTLRVDGSSYLGRVYQDPSIPDEFFYVVPSEAQRPRWVTQSVVQNALVLWVGDLPLVEEEAQPATETEAAATDETQATETYIPEPRRITVAVSQQDAISLNYLILTDADLNFVLRSAGDDQLVQTEPVTLQFIMDQYNIPYPTKLPYGMSISAPVPVEGTTE